MLPHAADAIIIGAGAVGCSIAYHLTKLGLKDVVILEKEAQAGAGSTARACGGIRAQFATRINIQLSLKSMDILDSLEEDMKEEAEYTRAGYLFMTSENKNWNNLQELLKIQQEEGVDVEALSKSEIKEKAPFASTDDLLGGTFGRRDGFVSPSGLTTAFLKAAVKNGARVFLDTQVTGFTLAGKRIRGVKTTAGEVKSEVIVNAAGPFASAVSELAGVKVPVAPIRRHVAVTGIAEFMPPRIPMTIDYDSGLVLHMEGRSVAVACADPREKPSFDTSFDSEFFEFISPKVLKRFPVLETAGIDTKKSWAGLYEVTPDNHPILGKIDEVEGLYLANGFSGHGVMHSPAVGLILSELILKEKAESLDISSLNFRRFKEGKLLVEKTVL